MRTYDIAIIGGGPAGITAAIRAGQLNKNVILIEKTGSLGKKLLLTGNGRCNITNLAPLDEFIEKFGENEKFYRDAFNGFFNNALINFFRVKGLDFKSEKKNCIFPKTNSAVSVLRVLQKYLAEFPNIKIIHSLRVENILKAEKYFIPEPLSIPPLSARRVIIAAGGASYPATGSAGDGYKIAEKLGHTVTPILPALVPLVTKEKWVCRIAGTSFDNARVSLYIKEGKTQKMIFRSPAGEMLFTHTGISGPLALDISGHVAGLLSRHGRLYCELDCLPDTSKNELKDMFMKARNESGLVKFKNYLDTIFPYKFSVFLLDALGINGDIKLNQVTQEERSEVINAIKAMPLTIVKTLPLEDAMVTSGGVSVKEINPKTMESRVAPGVFFAGEIIDGCGPSGGFNLQKAFSTGYLAGESAARSV